MKRLPWVCLPFVVLSFGCAEEASSNEEDFLESVTALERNLEFESVVYVPLDSTDSNIANYIDRQARTALGSLLHSEIGVNTKELRGATPASWVKEPVDVFSDNTHTKTRSLIRVRYKYTDKAIMPKALARRTSVPLAVLAQFTVTNEDALRVPCTANNAHSRSYPLWYELDTASPSCQSFISSEQKAVRAASSKLSDPSKEVSEAEVARSFVPIKVRLRPTSASRVKTYPEYAKLFGAAGGVEPGKLVIGILNGPIDDGDVANDSGWTDYFDQLQALSEERKFTLVAVEGSTPAALLPGSALDLSTFVRKRADRTLRGKVMNHWLTFEAPMRVRVANEAERDFVIKVQVNFGGTGALKTAIKTSDVFVYNGHSYLGGGPMSPSNFTPSDFPKSYQILWFDSCLSYNYYEKDYFPLKQQAAGTRTGMDALELITNGLEAPSYNSGHAIGALLAGLISGTQPSYEDLLKAAIATDPLRVVDGDLDNSYKPAKTPIVLKDR